MANILITGTNRGIGLEFVKQYLAAGHHVFATCRDPANAGELSSLAEGNPSLTLLALDVGSDASIDALPGQLAGVAIDIFINNAGVYGPRDVEVGKMDGSEWSTVFRINAIAPLLVTQALMQNLRAGQDKVLAYITSKMGSIADNQGGGSYIYRSSKAALNAAVRSLAIDHAHEGFKAAVLHPGWVRTDMGGPNGLIDTTTSVSGLIEVIDQLDHEKSGGFFNYDGNEIPW